MIKYEALLNPGDECIGVDCSILSTFLCVYKNVHNEKLKNKKEFIVWAGG